MHVVGQFSMIGRSGNDLGELIQLSAQLGRDSQLVQASTGNTSIKVGDTLWVKASGKWLARAGEEFVFVPVPLHCRDHFLNTSLSPLSTGDDSSLRPSIETAMHLALPHRVVVHIHSVNVISWAVRGDGRAEVEKRLKGMDWRWVPYAFSGAPLANALVRSLAADVFVLANHGLVVGAATCKEALALISEVERRLSATPREISEPDLFVLDSISKRTGYRLPLFKNCHALGTNPQFRNILRRGILYPCQAIYFGADFRLANETEHLGTRSESNVLLIEGLGVLVRTTLKLGAEEILLGLTEVLRRIPADAPIQFLTSSQVQEVLDDTVYPDYCRPASVRPTNAAATAAPIPATPVLKIPDSR